MCVYGEAYIRHVTLSNCQRGQVKIWLKHWAFSDFEKLEIIYKSRIYGTK